jgi:iron complex transport system ATP-binding protein
MNVSEIRQSPARLQAEQATLGYEKRVISEELSVAIPDESFTVIVGPNACGKSTLLRGLSRLLKPSAGRVILDGADIHSYRAKQVAARLGLLPQSSIAPDGIRVADLVARGRYPYQKLLRQWRETDERAVFEAMEATGVTRRRRSCCSTNPRRFSTSVTRSNCSSSSPI